MDVLSNLPISLQHWYSLFAVSIELPTGAFTPDRSFVISHVPFHIFLMHMSCLFMNQLSPLRAGVLCGTCYLSKIKVKEKLA